MEDGEVSVGIEQDASEEARVYAEPSERPDTPPPPASDPLARVALATIREVTDEVGRLVRTTATRVAYATPVGPLLRALFGEPRAELAYDGDADSPEADGWVARVLDAEQALAVAVRRNTQAEERCERLVAELRETRDREQALEAELAATLERACAERDALTRRADELVAVAEAQRAEAAADAEAARGTLSAAQQDALALRNELSLARGELARLAAALEDAQLAREKLVAEVQGLRGQLAESQDRLRTLEVELARVTEDHRRSERAAAAEQAERDARWQDEIANVRLEQVRERDRAQALAEEIERRRVEGEARDRREQRLQEELRAVTARADADREETVRRAQEMVQTAERARATLVGEMEALRTTSSSERASNDAAAAELAFTVGRLTQVEKDFLAVQHELSLVQRQMDKLCSTHDDLVEDNARLSVFLEETRASEAALRTQTAELREQIRGLESERVRLVAAERQHEVDAAAQAAAAAKASALETEVASLRAWARTLEDEVAQATHALEQATARDRCLEDAVTASERTAREHEANARTAQELAQTAERERSAIACELESLRTALAAAQRVILEAEQDTRVARSEAERLVVSHDAALTEQERLRSTLAESEAAAAPSVAPAPATPAVEPAPDSRVLVVLDTTPTWPATGGADVQVLAPGPDVVARVGELRPGRCVVNLSAPGAIEAAVALRAARLDLPLWGTILAAEGDRGLSLGPIEVLTRPIDRDVVRTQCLAIAPKNARILAIGSDSTTFIALRQGLMRSGMSVSIAWDLKQAAELMQIVRGHMVVLDLSLPARGAAALVAQLARVEKSPTVVLLPGTTTQVAAFSTALAALVPVEGARTQQNLLRTVLEPR